MLCHLVGCLWLFNRRSSRSIIHNNPLRLAPWPSTLSDQSSCLHTLLCSKMKASSVASNPSAKPGVPSAASKTSRIIFKARIASSRDPYSRRYSSARMFAAWPSALRKLSASSGNCVAQYAPSTHLKTLSISLTAPSEKVLRKFAWHSESIDLGKSADSPGQLYATTLTSPWPSNFIIACRGRGAWTVDSVEAEATPAAQAWWCGCADEGTSAGWKALAA
mmetsp:Transcript_12593/g.28515  ORF Transcript_12593/g.28515 Transcript_12593/m.28515 type:complete len:220 (+) Transcript_12593:1590-2249(+)